MATVSAAFRQQKPTAGRSGKVKAADLQRTSSAAGTATRTSPTRQPDAEAVEAALRQFDLSSDFGPSTGMTRLQRWRRAERLGLHPPVEIKQLLEQFGDMGEGLWHGRV